ncbi:MAG: hypothetical protein ICV78_16910, partial [Tolypothrix sp. Co-bin9]|nr:hypothetical protein [Tolypothrix sp. Co-bin9]
MATSENSNDFTGNGNFSFTDGKWQSSDGSTLDSGASGGFGAGGTGGFGAGGAGGTGGCGDLGTGEAGDEG